MKAILSFLALAGALQWTPAISASESETLVRNAHVIYEADGRAILKASLFLGANPCYATGARAGLMEQMMDGQLLLQPYISRDESAPEVCSDIGDPQYTDLSYPLAQSLDTITLNNYQLRGQDVAVKDLLALLYSVQDGGFCRGGCPKYTHVLNYLGQFFELIELSPINNPEANSSEYQLLNNVDGEMLRRIEYWSNQLSEGPLMDGNPDAPFCADIPSERYYSSQPDLGSILFYQQRDCHHYYLEGTEARLLASILESLQ